MSATSVEFKKKESKRVEASRKKESDEYDG
jgi:hypothetical protein